MKSELINGCVNLISRGDMVIVASNYKSGMKCFEPETFVAVDLLIKQGGLILDIGAYTGIYSIYCAVKYNCRAFAFEPNLDVFERLRNNIDLNNVGDIVQPFNFALSSKHDEVPIYTNPHTPLSSGGSIDNDDVLKSKHQLTQTHAYDDLLYFDPVDLIKIDVEGHEYDVLLGLEHTINRDKPPIIVECLTMDVFSNVSSLLKTYNYKLNTVLDQRNYLFTY